MAQGQEHRRHVAQGQEHRRRGGGGGGAGRGQGECGPATPPRILDHRQRTPRHGRGADRGRDPHPAGDAGALGITQAGLPITQAGLPITQAGLPITQAGLPITQAALPITQAGLPITPWPTPPLRVFSGKSFEAIRDEYQQPLVTREQGQPVAPRAFG
ncbi:hypothetical protein [Actinoplanes sp. NPDC051494]|uniref:hypothetical protein n=1 Tax=Actinoplanes sp. NPDC051494 TaxID=3363907 RepID=UPI0037919E10